MKIDDLVINLNAPEKEERLGALQELKKLIDEKKIESPETGSDVNNHIHTTFSFSPYSPTKAVFEAWKAGLCTAGIIDHDSVGGVREFAEAGKIMNFPTTSGFELRSTHSHTAIGMRKTNNPDQGGISYLTFHGLPATVIPNVEEFLKPVHKARDERNRKMCANLNNLLGFDMDYDRDVATLSQSKYGGSVTERHLLFAVAKRMVLEHGKGEALISYLKGLITLDPKVEKYLSDTQSIFYEYDLMGALKADLVEKFYVPANEIECPKMENCIKFADENGIIVTYAYLGDIGQSVTGDKKAAKFEDEFLDELIETVVGLGFKAISYMPSRNTRAQLLRIRALCEKYNLLQVSGEDINSPRQKFICESLRDPLFSNLLDTTWLLIEQEKAAAEDINNSFPKLKLSLEEKFKFYEKWR
ncbi:MAG: PHP domain-containing protein [Lachnospiraceae bacterium]|nr:PHP domain-containing protein [Lachnospiraceae bacterium]